MTPTRRMLLSIMLLSMMAAPALPVPAEQQRAGDIIFHVTTFSDGKSERTLSFPMAGIDISGSIAIPNGARVVSATMNVTGLPAGDGGTEFPQNVTIDAGDDGIVEYRFRGQGFGPMGYQTLFANGRPSMTVNTTAGGQVNSTAAFLLPSTAVVTSAAFTISSPGGAVTCFLDIGDNGSAGLSIMGLNGPVRIPDISAQLNEWLARATVSGTDDYGNRMTLVPLLVSLDKSGSVILDVLTVSYMYNATVDRNPVLGNLTGSLNAVIPTKYDCKTTIIPMAVMTSSAGKVRFSGLRIDYIPPVHTAVITMRYPEEAVVIADENTTAEFMINAYDPYNYPLNTSWIVNGKTVLRSSFYYGLYLDFDANGTYNVTVSVNNTLQKTATSWQLIVRNVNRRPVIDSFWPERTFEMDEGTPAKFRIEASDPDSNPMQYTWYIDKRKVQSYDANYEYAPDYSAAGTHEIKAVVTDNMGAMAAVTWTVTVNNVNQAPEITGASPGGTEVSVAENSVTTFSVQDLSPDGDPQSIHWTVDDIATGATGHVFLYATDYYSAGTHSIKAEVSDGEFAAVRRWNVTVKDANRPPVAKISSPATGAEFLLGEAITLDGSSSSDPDGDSLSRTWTEDDRAVGIGDPLVIRPAKGRHVIALTVDDGRGGGIATDQIEIRVLYLDFRGSVSVDMAAPVEGRRLAVVAELTNWGDGSVDELPVAFMVDGARISTTTVANVRPGSECTLEFGWDAVRGSHKLQVGLNGQNFTRTLTVARVPAPAPPAPANNMAPLAVAAAVVIMGLLAALAMTGTARRKPSARPPDATEEPGLPPADVVPAPDGPDAGATGMPPDGDVERKTPGMETAREAIRTLEAVLADAEDAGMDTRLSRQSLVLARHHLAMGRHEKALACCRSAEDEIR